MSDRIELMRELFRRGYRGPFIDVPAAADAILAGRPPAEVMAMLEPEFARAHATKAWLLNGAPLELAATGEIGEGA